MRIRESQLRNRARSAFTLIEVLTVIVIIGILIGLLVPAVNVVRRSVANSRTVFDVRTLGDSIEQYKTKFSDYPPDGSNRSLFERHFRKAFPNIDPTEFTTLYSVSNNASGEANALPLNPNDTVMDPAEALVFCLGGFSDDPAHPFTGPGGPLAPVPGVAGTWQYNTNRSGALYEFRQEQLTLIVDIANNRTLSNDEEILGGYPASQNDLLPVCTRGSGSSAPFVYFDSRTYSFAYGTSHFFNAYLLPNGGVARPYKSGGFNTNVAANSTDIATQDAYVQYVNPRSFQIISAGLDDNFGGVIQQAGTPPTFYKFPSGDAVDIQNPTGSGFSRYREQQGIPSSQLDNAASFTDSILENAIDN